ncbi:DUF4381 domain-containing protein [Myxosarcina sp. GI1(2024)]
MTAAERLTDPSFGNYMLNGLREIALPEPPNYRPQTVGWAILAGVALLGLMLWGIQCYRIWRQNRYRRAALKRLAELERLSRQSSTKTEALRELPALLKRTALTVYPREQVAQLYGDDWLTFLDSTYNGDDFIRGDGRLLSQLPYQPPEAIAQLSALVVNGLISAARNWIASHQTRLQARPRTKP